MATWSRFVVVLAVVSALATAPAGAGGQSDAVTAAAEGVPDDVVMTVQIRDDGSAAWSVEHRYRLDDDDATEAFESLRRDIEADRSAYAERFATRMGDTVRAAEASTGREMAVENVTVDAEKRHLPREYGIVTYRFEWTGFAAVEGGRITAGDALAGFFLDSNTRLLISWPDGYAARDVSPDPDERRERTAVWVGRTDFGPDAPEIVVTDGTGGPSTLDGVTVGLVLVATALVGAAGWWVRSRRGSPARPTRSAGGAPADGAPAAGSAGSSADGSGPNGDEGTPAELLSNEEQVLRVIERRGGRVKQQEVVRTLGWTDAKTSQVVGDLRESGAVESFRLGRENVLVLPDERDEIES